MNKQPTQINRMLILALVLILVKLAVILTMALKLHIGFVIVALSFLCPLLNQIRINDVGRVVGRITSKPFQPLRSNPLLNQTLRANRLPSPRVTLALLVIPLLGGLAGRCWLIDHISAQAWALQLYQKVSDRWDPQPRYIGDYTCTSHYTSRKLSTKSSSILRP